jgi:plastocyanin
VTKLLALAATAVAALATHPAAPARLGVGATEFHLVLSRASVKTGKVVIELQNQGEDVHDLQLRKFGGKHTYSFPLASPGARVTKTLKLPPGRYRLWCSVADHRQLGMRTTLRVRR